MCATGGSRTEEALSALPVPARGDEGGERRCIELHVARDDVAPVLPAGSALSAGVESARADHAHCGADQTVSRQLV